MKRIVLVACFVLAPVPALADNTPVTTRASSEDCAIFAALGKAKLGWSAERAPEGYYHPETTEYDDGHEANIATGQPDRIYLAHCSWRDLHLAEPVLQPPPEPGVATRLPLVTYNFGRPYYFTGQAAQASWSKIIVESKDGKPAVTHNVEMCQLRKTDEVWVIADCKPLSGFTVPDSQSPPHSPSP